MTTTHPPPATGRQDEERQGRSLRDVAFIRDRVLAEIRANPSQRPYLGEKPKVRAVPKATVPRPRRETCQQGHPITGEGRQRRCPTCARLRKRRARRKEATG